MEAVGKSDLVVFREITENDVSPLLVGSNLMKEKANGTLPKRAMAAHLGNRFGPLIAIINGKGFHVHPNVAKSEKEVLYAIMTDEQQKRQTVAVLKNANVSSYRRNATLTLNVKYTPSLAQRKMERAPQLHLYLSDNVARGVTIVTDLDEDNSNVLRVKMKLRLVTPSVPYDCLLNVQAYAQYKNESAQWCLNQCGYANVSLPEALAKKKRSCKRALRVNNSDNPDRDDKGVVEVRVVSFLFDDSPQEQVPVDTTASACIDLETSEKYARQYIHENRKRCYESVPASSESIERVTVFTFQTQSHGYVPGSYFDVFRIPKSHAEYTLNSLEHGRRRSHLIDRDPETRDGVSLLEFFRKASRRACLKVIMWASGVYVTSCTYITDEVDHNHRRGGGGWNKGKVELMESFDNMITRDAGDCEDFTRAILVFVHSLKCDYGTRASEQDGPKSDADEVILRAVDMLNAFVFCSGLCGVSSMALDDLKNEQKSGERVELNGHEAAFAIPRATFLKAISRHDPSSPVATYMQQEAERYPRYYSANDIIYPLEGTGVLNPEPYSKSQEEKGLEEALRKLGEHNSFHVMEDARALFTYDPHGGNNFYKMFITLMTPEFMVLRGIPVIEFVLYERNEHRESYRGGQHIGKRGVWFDELLNIGKNDHICIVGCPPLTPKLEAACSTLTKDNVPIWKPFVTIADAPPEWLEYERALGGPVSERSAAADLRVNYFLPACLASPDSVNELLALSKATGCKLNCRLELIRQNPNGHKVGNFVISFSKQP